MRLYLAGPLFTKAELDFNRHLAYELRALTYDVFLPQEVEHPKYTPDVIFALDVAGINTSEAIVANMDGADPDSGTCWECGYGYAKGMPIILYRTDVREEKAPLGPYNLMMHQASDAVLDCQGLSVATIAGRIHAALAYGAIGK